jgi:hypothetical protein
MPVYIVVDKMSWECSAMNEVNQAEVSVKCIEHNESQQQNGR